MMREIVERVGQRRERDLRSISRAEHVKDESQSLGFENGFIAL